MQEEGSLSTGVAAGEAEGVSSDSEASNVSSLLSVLGEKESELKELRSKVGALQEAYHNEQLERTKLEHKVQFMENEYAHALQVHKLQLDAALAQKKAAWYQATVSIEKHRTEIEALQLKQGPAPSSSHGPTLSASSPTPYERKPSSLEESYIQDQELYGSQTDLRKDLKKADNKMAQLKSSGDTVYTELIQEQDPGYEKTGTDHSRWHEGPNRTGAPPLAPYHQSIRVGKLQHQLSALTLETFPDSANPHAQDENVPAGRSSDTGIHNSMQSVRELATIPSLDPSQPSRPLSASTGTQGTHATSGQPREIIVEPIDHHRGDVNRQEFVLPSMDPSIPSRPQRLAITNSAITNSTTGMASQATTGQVSKINMQHFTTSPVPTEEWNVVGEGSRNNASTPATSVGDIDDDDESGPSEVSTSFGEDRVRVVSKVLVDPYGERGVYTGVILLGTGLPHGPGRMQYADVGRSYDGDWRHGRWYGFGKATFSNGDEYEGMYVNDKREGPGVYKWKDGRLYDGEFHDDKRHGKGTFLWPDGSLYDGDFANGLRDGHGIYQYADGGRYEGGWEGGKYNGVGTCIWADGRKYHGEWKAGVCHGQGVETMPDGTVRHQGEWADDEPISD